MNLSETAFVFSGQEEADFALRYFTPTEEVDLCGHATIASLALIRDLDLAPGPRAKIKTKAGLLGIYYEKDGSVMMDQAPPERLEIDLDLATLASVLGIREEDLGLEGVLDRPEAWSTGLADLIVPLASVKALEEMSPDMEALAQMSRDLDLVGVHAFSLDDEGTYWARNLAPAVGIPEEAATGTANGALGACLFDKGLGQGGLLNLEVRQGVWMGRPSTIRVQVTSQGVRVGGQAVLVLKGEIIF